MDSIEIIAVPFKGRIKYNRHLALAKLINISSWIIIKYQPKPA